MEKVKEPNLISLGVRIKKRRLELKLTQKELARKANLGKQASYISSIELGYTDIPSSNLLPLSEALDTNVCYLLGLTENATLSNNDVCALLTTVPTPEEEPEEENRTIRPEVMRLFATIASVRCRKYNI